METKDKLCQNSVYHLSLSHKVAKQNITLKLDKHQLLKEQHPTYLGVTLDRQLNLKKHVLNVKNKALRRLQLLKKLAGTTWGSDKDTLRGLYLGYIRSAIEYNSALLTTCSAGQSTEQCPTTNQWSNEVNTNRCM